MFKNAQVVWKSDALKATKTEDIVASMASAGYYKCYKDGCGPESVGKKQAASVLLNNAPASYPGALLRFTKKACYHYICSRNNNFSNRSQKGTLCIAWFILTYEKGKQFFLPSWWERHVRSISDSNLYMRNYWQGLPCTSRTPANRRYVVSAALRASSRYACIISLRSSSARQGGTCRCSSHNAFRVNRGDYRWSCVRQLVVKVQPWPTISPTYVEQLLSFSS